MEINDKLFTLKKDFSLWRSKRKRGTPVPRELKERACSLLEDEDVYRVVKLEDIGFEWAVGNKEKNLLKLAARAS